MHPNPAFRATPQQVNIDFARKRGFGALCVNAANGPLVSHIPFQLSKDGTLLEAHLVRSNPIVGLLSRPQPAVVAVAGADGYISPDWYDLENQVPTWNYVAVHLRGSLKMLEPGALRGVLERLADDMEERLLPKKPWTLDKMDSEVLARLSRMIVPVALEVSEIDSTWKLAQNKPASARLGAAIGLERGGIGMGLDELAGQMRVAGDDAG